jgi:hypothetical protein
MFSQTIPVEKLNIIYADMSDIITYNVKKRDLSEWIKMRIGEIEDSLLEKKFHVLKLRDFASIADTRQSVTVTEMD